MRYSREKISQPLYRRPATTFIAGLPLSENRVCENCHSSLDLSGENDEKLQNDLVIIQPDGSIEENENFENIIPSSIEPEVPVTPKPEVENISPPDIEKSLDVNEEKIDSPRKVSTPPELATEKNSTVVDRLVINQDSPRNGKINLISCFLVNLFFTFKTSFCR